MNYVLIKAGGIGQRMQPSDKPKQFMEVYGKPIIVYTLERFQNCSAVDEIWISCLEGWIDYTNELIKKYGLTKVKGIVEGGSTGHLSILNGINAIKQYCKTGDIVTIHDAVRPLFDEKLYFDAMEKVKKYDAVVTCAVLLESTFVSEDMETVGEHLPNYKIFRAQAPQVYQWDKLKWAYEESERQNIIDAISTDNLFSMLNIPQHIIVCGQHNFKITTKDDLELFAKILKADNMP